jgi:hypothetical protein
MTVVSAATLFHRPEHAHVDLSDLAETADFLDRTYGVRMRISTRWRRGRAPVR